MSFRRPTAKNPRAPKKPAPLLPLIQEPTGTVAQWPIHTVSEANRAGSEHWRVRQKRAKSQRETAAMLARTTLARPSFPCVVSLRRCAPARNRIRDAHENYPMAFKHVVDGIADWLGVNDGDTSKVRWRYEPEQKADGFAVVVRIEVGT